MTNNPLPVVAKEINVRLSKADKLLGDADDHRLAAALRIAEAESRVTAGEAGDITWVKWRSKNINRSKSEINKLLKIGQSPDPATVIAAHRTKNTASKQRTRIGADVGAAIIKQIQKLEQTQNREQIWDACWSLFCKLDCEDQLAFIDRCRQNATVPA